MDAYTLLRRRPHIDIPPSVLPCRPYPRCFIVCPRRYQSLKGHSVLIGMIGNGCGCIEGYVQTKIICGDMPLLFVCVFGTIRNTVSTTIVTVIATTIFMIESGFIMPQHGTTSQLALRRWPNVGIGRHRRDRQPTSRQRWYSVACVATVCWHSVGARRLAYPRSLPMFCVWTSVVGNQVFLE